MRINKRRARWATVATVATVAVSLLSSSLIVWQSSYAAFSNTTSDPSSSWTAGSVNIGNDHTGSALFTVPLAKPATSATSLDPPSLGPFAPAGGATTGGSACVKVTYSGTLTSNIHLYSAITTVGGLGQYLLFSVDTGTNVPAGASTDPACATFTSVSYLYGGSATNSTIKLDGFASNSNYANGLAGWDGAVATNTKWYRFSWLLPYGVADAAQSMGVSAMFTWEAQNT